MDIISYLEFKTNASDFTIPLMVYDGQLSQVHANFTEVFKIMYHIYITQ